MHSESSDSSEAQAALQALRREFGGQLHAELGRLREDAARLLSGAPERALLEDLRQRCHRLVGTTLTLGFTATGMALRTVEQALDAALVAPGADWARIVLLLQSVPNEASAAPPERSKIAWRMAPLAVPRHEGPPLVYLLEDDRALADRLLQHLQGMGYRTRLLQQRAELEIAITEARPDVLIVDVELHSDPGFVSGFCARLNATNEAAIPLVVLSGRASFEDQLQAVRLGAISFFRKPVDIPALQERLDSLFKPQPEQPYRVLLVDDDAHLLAHYRQLLASVGAEPMTLQAPDQILEAMERFNPDLLVFDLHMPRCSGIELSRLIRLHNAWTHIPIVFLSAEQAWHRQRDALIRGADDFLTKPFADDDFVALVLSRAERSRHLAGLMSRDSLTGLLKHTEIKDRLQRELARAQRHSVAMTAAMVDIDHFKRVNDQYGHPMGDKVIQGLARLLSRSLRPSDFIGRYGGEEFLVVLPDCDATTAVQRLDQLREEFGRIPFLCRDEIFHCSFSAGVAAAAEGRSADALIAAADAALYAAKRGGRNQVQAEGNAPAA